MTQATKECKTCIEMGKECFSCATERARQKEHDDVKAELKEYREVADAVLEEFFSGETIASAIPSMNPDRYSIFEKLMVFKAKAEGKPDPVKEWQNTPDGKKFVEVYGEEPRPGEKQ